jgi:D-alanyl-D-alanine carboxypeptidase
MRLVRAFGCSACSSLAFVLFIGTAFAAPNITVGTLDKSGTLDTSDQCAAQQACIDSYLWSVYERAPKIDTVKVPERRKVKIKRKGKVRTVTKAFTKLAAEDFTWKDLAAAQHAGLSLIDYVIGGMDQAFRLTLYRALRAMDAAGLEPGITSAFRDDYRQSIAAGQKARADDSYHGGSRHGGYGHGLAVDLVSVKGATRAERWASSEELWKWIDAHGKDFGIGRPYLDRDAPHVGPIDGKEYISHRGGANTQQVALHKKHHVALSKRHRRLAHNDGRRVVWHKRHHFALHKGRHEGKRA